MTLPIPAARERRGLPRNGTSTRHTLFVPLSPGIPFTVRLRVASTQATPATITALAFVLMALAAFRTARVLWRHAVAMRSRPAAPVRRRASAGAS